MTDSKLEDDDPIIASYDIYVKPKLGQDRQIYVLQYPNRSQGDNYHAGNNSAPLSLRTKPQNGMVEIDIPINAWENFDRLKAIQFGEALKESNATKGRGSHGLPGGFGIGGAIPRGKNRGKTDEEVLHGHLNTLNDFAGAVERNQALNKKTLGGQVVPKNQSCPVYMIGAFKHNQLHLTPVDEFASLRPQFHHIDAMAEQKRMNQARDAPAAAPVAKAVHLTVKAGVPGEDTNADTVASRITATQAEKWKQHRFVEESQDEAWMVYSETLFVGGAQTDDNNNNEEVLHKLPKLVASLDNSEYLDAISAPGDKAKLSRSKQMGKGKGKGKEPEVVSGAGMDSASADTVMVD